MSEEIDVKQPNLHTQVFDRYIPSYFSATTIFLHSVIQLVNAVQFYLLSMCHIHVEKMELIRFHI